jgi:hypothetical protein
MDYGINADTVLQDAPGTDKTIIAQLRAETFEVISIPNQG